MIDLNQTIAIEHCGAFPAMASSRDGGQLYRLAHYLVTISEEPGNVLDFRGHSHIRYQYAAHVFNARLPVCEPVAVLALECAVIPIDTLRERGISPVDLMAEGFCEDGDNVCGPYVLEGYYPHGRLNFGVVRRHNAVFDAQQKAHFVGLAQSWFKDLIEVGDAFWVEQGDFAAFAQTLKALRTELGLEPTVDPIDRFQ